DTNRNSPSTVVTSPLSFSASSTYASRMARAAPYNQGTWEGGANSIIALVLNCRAAATASAGRCLHGDVVGDVHLRRYPATRFAEPLVYFDVDAVAELFAHADAGSA